MTFPINVNIPNAPNDPADDQPIMKQNFANISGYLAVDHVAAGTINAGIHKQVHLINQAAPALVGTGGVMYGNIATGNAWPFWRNGIQSYQLVGAVSATANNGMAFLPGGLILKWGFVNSVSNGSVSFSPAFPTTAFTVFTQPYYTPTAPSSGGVATVAVLTPVTTTGFTWKFLTPSDKYTGFYWVAIGN